MDLNRIAELIAAMYAENGGRSIGNATYLRLADQTDPRRIKVTFEAVHGAVGDVRVTAALIHSHNGVIDTIQECWGIQAGIRMHTLALIDGLLRVWDENYVGDDDIAADAA